MEDYTDSDGTGPFEAMCQEAQTLGIADYKGAKALLVSCKAANLTAAETMMVMSIIVEVTELDKVVVRALQKEVRNQHQSYGAIDDIGDLAEALKREITARLGRAKVTGGSLYTYRAAAAHDSFGVWSLLNDSDVERILMESFSVDLTARAPLRSEALRRVYASLEEPDAFAGADTGLALENGFLHYDSTGCSFELRAHSPDHLARNKVGVAYVPSASSHNFQRGLLRAFGGDKVKMTAFLEFTACAVFGEKPAEDAVRTCLTLFGSQRTGKSTLIELCGCFS